MKQKKLVEDLKESRARQIEDIRKQQAVALARDEEDFMKVSSMQHATETDKIIIHSHFKFR